MKVHFPKVVLDIVSRPHGTKGFVLLPRSWVVERTFAWLGLYRRLSKDYEKLVENSAGMIYLASIHCLDAWLYHELGSAYMLSPSDGFWRLLRIA